ncbi:MAG: extracellular solute-binding protein [Oscillospiraceae bacterium]|nr:extracellular solute-binding protein [Oscillospiraceae bacterium]
MKKSILILFVIFALMLPAFMLSCSGDPKKGNETITAENESPGDTTESESVASKTLPEIPDADYGGHKFNILISLATLTDVIWNDFHAEEENGDTMNDAVYKRNIYVEEKYNVKIVDKEGSSDDLKNSIYAGDNAYDTAMLAGYSMLDLVLDGCFMDMNDMAPLNLTKPWWDQKANRDLMIKNKMFYTTGDISNVVNEATCVILFNKKLVREYGMESPYDLVKRGEWTYDKLIELGMQLSGDLNGDGKMDLNDRYGAFVWDDAVQGAINSIGEKCAKLNSDDELELTLNNERVLSMFDAYINFVLDKNHALIYQRQDWSGEKTNAMFANDQGLFYLHIMELVVRLRAMDINFGVLPYPKLDTSQNDYYSLVNGWHAGFMCVPIGQQDPERTGAILEALAAESTNTLKPAYYDIALKGKLIRDEESEEMLDLIFDSKMYDLGWLYKIGYYYEEVMNLVRNRKTNFASMYEKSEPRAIKEMEEINAAFNEIF